MPTGSRSPEREPIRFTAELSTIEDATLIRLPQAASEQLPSRGQVAVRASLGGHRVRDRRRAGWPPWPLDPRGRVPSQGRPGSRPGDTAEVSLEVAADWPEPDVPDDLAAALADAPTRIHDVWQDITPMARWEWVRWVQATANPATRQRRVEVSISKLDGGKRRPCCFDLASCTDPELARSGKLREMICSPSPRRLRRAARCRCAHGEIRARPSRWVRR